MAPVHNLIPKMRGVLYGLIGAKKGSDRSRKYSLQPTRAFSDIPTANASRSSCDSRYLEVLGSWKPVLVASYTNFF